MTAVPSARNFPRVIIEVVLAVLLTTVGSYALLLITEQRPYLGQPATSDLQVPYRVLEAPNVPALLLFLAAVFAVAMGLSWFMLRLIHQLLFKPVRPWRVWREAFFVGVFVISLAWLQLNQAFSLLLMAVVAVSLILLEIFLNIRGRDE
jgi:hypothetical protein